MTEQSSILEEQRDLDTLGGRIGRAREASGIPIDDIAVQLGVDQATWDNWESDREEPRANRLAMLAGFLNVSPSWLLYGVGEAPNNGDISEIITTLEQRLQAIEEAHAQTGEAVKAMHDILARLSAKQNHEA